MSDETEKTLESAYGHLEPDPAVGERLLDSLPEERLAARSLARPMATVMGLLVVLAVTVALWNPGGGAPDAPTFLAPIRFVTEGELQRTAEIMRSRLESLGVIGARVETGPHGLDVSLPETAPVETVQAALSRPGTLEFRIVAEVRDGEYVFEEPENRVDAFGGDDIDPESVTIHPPQGLGFMVGVEFMDDRKDDFADFTRRHLRRRLAILVDGEVISAPIIQDVIPGRCLISGGGPKGMTKEEAESLAAALRSGAYPGDVEIR
jgi:preprotein translocase subunit SecD